MHYYFNSCRLKIIWQVNSVRDSLVFRHLPKFWNNQLFFLAKKITDFFGGNLEKNFFFLNERVNHNHKYWNVTWHTCLRYSTARVICVIQQIRNSWRNFKVLYSSTENSSIICTNLSIFTHWTSIISFFFIWHVLYKIFCILYPKELYMFILRLDRYKLFAVILI